MIGNPYPCGPENVIETYYNYELFKGINFTLDYQLAADPGLTKIAVPSISFPSGYTLSFNVLSRLFTLSRSLARK
jgi:hypothetical protein